jgi:ubiquitin conjugation factor E4 B
VGSLFSCTQRRILIARSATLGAPELLPSLLGLSALSGPLSSSTSTTLLSPAEVPQFLADLSARFHASGELPGVLAPLLSLLCGHPSLADPAGLAAGDAGWRRVLGALDALLGARGGADALAAHPAFVPADADAVSFEHKALLGPLMRLGVVQRDWPYIAQAYFDDVERRTQADVDGSWASLRGTLRSLQHALFGILNALVRASASSSSSRLPSSSTGAARARTSTRRPWPATASS